MVTNSKLVTAPTEPVVSLSEIKNYLRIDNPADDAELPTYVAAAAKRIEAFLDQKLVTQTWDVFLDCFPISRNRAYDNYEGVLDMSVSEVLNGSGGEIKIPFGPVQSVTGVYTYDDADTEYLFASSNYSVDTSGKRGRLALKTGAVWPPTVLRPINGVRVRVVTGYGSASTIPEDIKQAVKILAAKLYESRGDSTDMENFKIPPTVFMLIDPYRSIKVGC